jgi:iron(III) transport system substrate-binding protein
MRLLLSAFALLIAALPTSQAQQPRELRLISDRTDQGVLRPMLDAFEARSGAKVTAVFMDQGLVNRLESRPTEADIVITKDAELLEIAANKGLLQPFTSSAIVQGIPAEFRDPQNRYFVDAYRARVIFYAKARVKPAELSSYEDLANPKWKGRICIRPGAHDYNLALFSQFIASYGETKGMAIIQGIANNLARTPKGNDREQAKGLFEGKCDVALVNTYYHYLMATNPEQKPWADASGLFYPDQAGKGAFIMRSAVGMTKATANRDLAQQLMEFLASVEGQEAMVRATRQFSPRPDVAVHPLLAQFGAEQGLKDGRFKLNFVPLAAVAAHREAVLKYVGDIKFDAER